MLQLTTEQLAKLCLPDPVEFIPRLAAEVRRDYPAAVANRSDAELQAEVQVSYQFAIDQLRITHLPTLVRWVKADVAWARGVRNQPLITEWFKQATHPNATAADLLAILAANTIGD